MELAPKKQIKGGRGENAVADYPNYKLTNYYPNYKSTTN
jgi:hypothetical protein